MKKLEAIQEALRTYDKALKSRKHGGIAASDFVEAVQRVLSWEDLPAERSSVFILTVEAVGDSREEAISQALRCLSGLVSHGRLCNRVGSNAGNAAANIEEVQS